MHHKVGDISKFAFAKGKVITDVQKANFKYIEEHTFGVCPKCGEQLAKKQTFKIIELVFFFLYRLIIPLTFSISLSTKFLFFIK